jgi:uncharacterized protein (DUF1684 family)
MLAVLLPDVQAAGMMHPQNGPSVTQSDSLLKAIEADRTKAKEWLRTSPTSYLAAIARVDFGEAKTLTLGSGPSNDIQIPEGVFAPRHLSVTVMGDSFLVRSIDPSASFKTRSGRILREAMLAPAYITVGRFSIRLSHQRYPAIIVFDPESPRYAEYKGLEYYPFDPSYRFTLPLIRNPEPDTVVILSTRGNKRNALLVGWFDVPFADTTARLEVSRLLEPGIGEHRYSIFFMDETTGDETYAVGRYLDVEQRPDGTYVLDFNMAYNPACAISPYYNCPLPPSANAIPVRVRAGEKDAQYEFH